MQKLCTICAGLDAGTGRGGRRSYDIDIRVLKWKIMDGPYAQRVDDVDAVDRHRVYPVKEGFVLKDELSSIWSFIGSVGGWVLMGWFGGLFTM